jgi:hypothetical protein
MECAGEPHSRATNRLKQVEVRVTMRRDSLDGSFPQRLREQFEGFIWRFAGSR